MAPVEAEGADGLVLLLAIAAPVVAGMSALAQIRLVNRGAAPLSVSARLNLMEGDLALAVQGPDGAARTLAGWQADTAPRRATLAPGEEIAGAINLLASSTGPVFPAPGRYTVDAAFSAVPRRPALHADPVAVEVRLPLTDEERAVAQLLQDPALREALLLATPDKAPDGLHALARFTHTLDGRLAALLAAPLAAPPAAGDAGADTPGTGAPAAPESDALAIAMLQTPFSHAGRGLAERFIRALEAPAANRDAPATPQAVQIALQIVRRAPFKRA